MSESGGLSLNDVVEVAARAADARGLRFGCEEKDRRLFIHLERGDESVPSEPTRRRVQFWTSGTGAFVADFDGTYSHQEHAYDRRDQTQAVELLVAFADQYLSGAGEARTLRTRPWPWRPAQWLAISCGEGTVLLRRRSHPARSDQVAP